VCLDKLKELQKGEFECPIPLSGGVHTRMKWMGIGIKWGCTEYILAVVGLVTVVVTVLVTMDTENIDNILKLWAMEGPRENDMGTEAPLLVDLTLVESTALVGADFYNWNRVKVRYCDGASYFGDVEDEIQEYQIYFRGQRIWQAIMHDLLVKGMDKADQGLLSGCSAGGLASFLHCDNFQELFSKNAKVKCLGDAGFFVDMKDISGAYHIRSFYNEVVTTQEIVNRLPKSCTSQMDPTRCFFPQYLLPSIQTPVFVLNAAYDSWQIQNILAPAIADPHGHWKKCKWNIKDCTPSQLAILQEFRTQMLNALQVFNDSRSGGMFINSCFTHCQTEMQVTWFSPNSPRLNNKTIAEVVGDWYFDRKVTKDIDCPYPCDSSCHQLSFKA